MHKKWIEFLGENRVRWIMFGIVLPTMTFSFGIELIKSNFWTGLTTMIVGFYPILVIVFTKTEG